MRDRGFDLVVGQQGAGEPGVQQGTCPVVAGGAAGQRGLQLRPRLGPLAEEREGFGPLVAQGGLRGAGEGPFGSRRACQMALGRREVRQGPAAPAAGP
ncbi:hypothetical protein C3486_29630 [Streptomyces sp. Ru73]|nr:hypothetical protein C3486_29630 [Streptomyces sp. Ru73]